MRSRSCFCRNLVTISGPNVNDTPRSFSPQPITSLSGSDQSKSHSRPWSGTSVGRMMRRICSIDCRSGLRPTHHSARCAAGVLQVCRVGCVVYVCGSRDATDLLHRLQVPSGVLQVCYRQSNCHPSTRHDDSSIL